MISTLRSVLSLRNHARPLADASPVREELFGLERLEQHARSLAEAQTVTRQPRRVPSLHARLEDNAKVLLAAYRTSAREMESGRGTVPAEEWLLDNYHLVEEQVDEARNDLPVKFYRQLPKLESGPFAGYPRVFGIAWAYVAHTDSHFDPDILRRFLDAYQTVQPLTIGELWAVAITLRIVMIENLRRLADQITVARDERAEAEALADQLAASGNARAALDARISARADGGIPEISRRSSRSACATWTRSGRRRSPGSRNVSRSKTYRSTWSCSTRTSARPHRTSRSATSSPACD